MKISVDTKFNLGDKVQFEVKAPKYNVCSYCGADIPDGVEKDYMQGYVVDIEIRTYSKSHDVSVFYGLDMIEYEDDGQDYYHTVPENVLEKVND